MNKVLVTGGAGFIGSHLVRRLISDSIEIDIIDNLSNGRLQNIKDIISDSIRFYKLDLLNDNIDPIVKNSDIVYHLAANPDVKIGSTNPRVHLEQNIIATFNILESIRKNDISTLVFTSSSTVYGDAEIIPTPENYGALKPISIYGASKLACEGLITSYASTYGFKAVILRLANIIGKNSTHGIIYDFINKLREDNTQLEVLGDGTQKKSYLYISDCIDGMLCAVNNSSSVINIFNLGSDDYIEVKDIASIVIKELGLKNVKIKYTGGVDGGRGWKGDVKTMLLDTSALKSLNWRARYNSKEAVRLTVVDMIGNRH